MSFIDLCGHHRFRVTPFFPWFSSFFILVEINNCLPTLMFNPSDTLDTGDPSIFELIRSVAALPRMFPTLELSCEENAGATEVEVGLHWLFIILCVYPS